MTKPFVLFIEAAFFVILVLFAFVFKYVDQSNKEISQQLITLQQSIAAQKTSPETLAPASTAMQPPTAQQVEVTEQYSQINPSPVNDVGTIFAPTETASGDATIDKIKSDFESLFVTYQFLYKCGLTQPADYHIINSAMAHEISSKNAPGRIQYDILTAAKGSYEEIYSRSDCNGPEISGMNQKFRNYIDEVSKLRFVID